jgi:purine catabolism regulator
LPTFCRQQLAEIGESVPQLTLADALRLPDFRRADPVVVAGKESLGRSIRWAHATEEANVSPLLRPGDLVLTMGTGLPTDEDAAGMREFALDLAQAEAAGLVVELGRRWKERLPQALVDACAEQAIPLVALMHETRFAALTQALGEQIVDGQLAELRDAQRVHETFTELSFDQAGPPEILDAVGRLAGGPVVLENAQNRPIDFLTGSANSTGFLDNWQSRSARVKISGRTGWSEKNGWLVTRLGSRDRDWGRLVIASPTPPTHRLVAVAERAAAALALHRLHDRDRDNHMRRMHYELMAGLQSTPDSEELLRRCELAGFPTKRRQYLGMVIRPRLGGKKPAETDEVVATTVRAAHGLRLAALVCLADRDIRILLSTSAATSPDALADRLARRVLEQHDVVVSAGRLAPTREAIDRSLLEARQVADAVPAGATTESGDGPIVHRLPDVHLRGLLALFGDDDRIRLFIERELGALRAHDDARGGRGDLLRALHALLHYPSSKTDAAASLHLSRAAFYERLTKIERILGIDLDDPDARVSLQVALIADELSAHRH